MTTAPRRKTRKRTGGWCVLFPRLSVRTTITEAERREVCRAAAGLLLMMAMSDAELAARHAGRHRSAPTVDG